MNKIKYDPVPGNQYDTTLISKKWKIQIKYKIKADKKKKIVKNAWPSIKLYEMFNDGNAKVSTHEGTSRRDLLRRLVPCSVYTMGLVAAGAPNVKV